MTRKRNQEYELLAARKKCLLELKKCRFRQTRLRKFIRSIANAYKILPGRTKDFQKVHNKSALKLVFI